MTRNAPSETATVEAASIAPTASTVSTSSTTSPTVSSTSATTTTAATIVTTEPVQAPAALAPAPVAAPPCPSGEQHLTAGGLERRYVVTRPDPTRGSAATRPLLLLFHGYTGSPESVTAASDLPAAAAAAGWVVVAPQGSGSPSHWAIQDLPGPDDVGFVRALLDEVSAGGCADPTRVAAAGYSNGAGFTAVLTCELDLIASAMVGGANLGPTCDVPDGYPLVIAHGQADDVVPVSGGPVIGGALHARSLVSTVSAWQGAGAAVRGVIVPGWGHAWTPGATDAVLAVLATFAV